MSITSAFTEHPASVGESYLQHMRVALGFGTRMVFAGIACLVHAVFPFLFVGTGSQCIQRLHECMVRRRRVAGPSIPETAPGLTIGETARPATR